MMRSCTFTVWIALSIVLRLGTALASPPVTESRSSTSAALEAPSISLPALDQAVTGVLGQVQGALSQAQGLQSMLGSGASPGQLAGAMQGAMSNLSGMQSQLTGLSSQLQGALGAQGLSSAMQGALQGALSQVQGALTSIQGMQGNLQNALSSLNANGLIPPNFMNALSNALSGLTNALQGLLSGLGSLQSLFGFSASCQGDPKKFPNGSDVKVCQYYSKVVGAMKGSKAEEEAKRAGGKIREDNKKKYQCGSGECEGQPEHPWRKSGNPNWLTDDMKYGVSSINPLFYEQFMSCLAPRRITDPQMNLECRLRCPITPTCPINIPAVYRLRLPQSAFFINNEGIQENNPTAHGFPKFEAKFQQNVVKPQVEEIIEILIDSFKYTKTSLFKEPDRSDPYYAQTHGVSPMSSLTSMAWELWRSRADWAGAVHRPRGADRQKGWMRLDRCMLDTFRPLDKADVVMGASTDGLYGLLSKATVMSNFVGERNAELARITALPPTNLNEVKTLDVLASGKNNCPAIALTEYQQLRGDLRTAFPGIQPGRHSLGRIACFPNGEALAPYSPIFDDSPLGTGRIMDGMHTATRAWFIASSPAQELKVQQNNGKARPPQLSFVINPTPPLFPSGKRTSSRFTSYDALSLRRPVGGGEKGSEGFGACMTTHSYPLGIEQRDDFYAKAVPPDGMNAWDKDYGQTTFTAWETIFTCTCSCESRPDVDACSYIDYRSFKGNGDNFIVADPPGINLPVPPPPILVLWPRLLLYTATEPPPACRGGAQRTAETQRGKARNLDLINPINLPSPPSNVIGALTPPQIAGPAIGLPIAPSIPQIGLPGGGLSGLQDLLGGGNNPLGSLPQLGTLLNNSTLPADVRALLGQNLVNLESFNTTLAALNGFSGIGSLTPQTQGLFTGALAQAGGIQGQLQQLQNSLQSLLNAGGLAPQLSNIISSTIGSIGNLAGNIGSLQSALQGIIGGGGITSSLQGALGAALGAVTPDVLGSIGGIVGVLSGTSAVPSIC